MQMKKFKLIKKYPGLFPLINIGDCVTQDYSTGMYHHPKVYTSDWCDKYFESFPENWKRIYYLFTTEDGVDINEGQNWWYVVLATLNPPKQTNKYTSISNNTVKRFSTKEAAWRFINITKNPVLFKTEDGKDVRKGDTTYGVKLSNFMTLGPIVHYDSTFHKSDVKEFSTEQLANLYVSLHAPKYSLQMILNAQTKSMRVFETDVIIIDLFKLENDNK